MIVAKDEGKSDDENEAKEVSTCPDHPGNPLTFYCENDDRLCCAECNLSPVHKDHILYGIAEYRANVEAKMATVAQNYDTDVRKLEHLQDLYMQYLDQTDATWETAATKVRDTFYRLHQILDEQEQNLLQYLEVKKQFSSMDDEHRVLEEDLSRIDDVYGSCISAYEKLRAGEIPLSEGVKVVGNLGEYNEIHERAQNKIIFPEVRIAFNPPGDEDAKEHMKKAWGSEISVNVLNRFKGPRSVRVESVQGRTAKITWDPVNLDYREDVMYQVELSRDNGVSRSVQTLFSQTSIVFNDLALNTDFYVRVRGGIHSTQTDIWSDWSDVLPFKVVDKQLNCINGHQLIRTNTHNVPLFKKSSRDQHRVPPFECHFCGKVLDKTIKPKEDTNANAAQTPPKADAHKGDDDDDDDNEGFDVFNNDDSNDNGADKGTTPAGSTENGEYDIIWTCPRCEFDLCDECATYELTHNFVSVRCNKYHKLSRMTIKKRLEADMDDSSEDVNSSILCNVCRKTFSNLPGAMVFHCASCDYDVCNTCGEELMQEKYRVITCNSGHRLVKLFIDDRLGRRSWCRCDTCKTRLIKGSMTRLFHCRPCGFDMCERCVNDRLAAAIAAPRVNCPGRHIMKYILLGQRIQSLSFIRCARCSKRISFESHKATYPLMSCVQCGYDLCAECAGLHLF